MNTINHQLVYKHCVDACYSCAAECERCATECLKEDDIQMLALCISLNRECALICSATAQLMSMGGTNASVLCLTCAELCDLCAEECERNAEMEHCKRCAIECRRCSEECLQMMEQLV